MLGNGRNKVLPSPTPPWLSPPHKKKATHDTKSTRVGLTMTTLANVQMQSINKTMLTRH